MSTIDLSQQPFTARLAAAGSRRTELLTLLAAASPTATPACFRQLVLEQNVTGKGSAAARAKVWRQLRLSYELDPAYAEYAAFRAALAAAPGHHDQGLLCYLLFARNDRLFRELTIATIAPALAHPATSVDVANVQDALVAKLTAQGISWTEETTVTVRQHLLSALKDFGVLLGGTKKRTVRLHPGPVVVWYAARLAELEGHTAAQTLTSVWFQLLGLDREGAIAGLREAAQAGVLTFRLQAEVVELVLPPRIE